jgi:DNA-binding MarR family transcriptional regulator
MNKEKYAEEFLKCMIEWEREGSFVRENIMEISRGEFAVLIYLKEKNDGVSAINLSQEFQINSSRVTAILNSLSKKELIERKNDPSDKRKIKVYITEKGKLSAERIKNIITHNVFHLVDQLEEDEAIQFIHVMKKMTEIVKHIDKQ